MQPAFWLEHRSLFQSWYLNKFNQYNWISSISFSWCRTNTSLYCKLHFLHQNLTQQSYRFSLLIHSLSKVCWLQLMKVANNFNCTIGELSINDDLHSTFLDHTQRSTEEIPLMIDENQHRCDEKFLHIWIRWSHLHP